MPEPLRILLIDDEGYARAASALQREFPGAEVTEARDWTSALEALRALRGRRPDSPVILYTSRGGAEAAREGERPQFSHPVVSKILRLSPVAISLTTVGEGRFLDVNDHFLSMFGYAREEVIGRTTADVGTYVDPADRARLVEALRASGVLRGFEARFRTRSGETRHALASYELIELEGETAILALAHDITDRKRTEEALRESEERYRRLVEVSPDAILIHRGGRITFVNPSGLRLFGARRPEDLVGTPVLDRVPPDCRGEVAERIRRVEAGDPAPPRERKLLRLDGSTVEAEVAAVPLSSEGGPAVQVVIRDISERKRAEDVLRRSQRQLVEAQQVGHVGSWEWDIPADTLAWSDELYRICGLERRQLKATYEGYLERVHPDDRDRVRGIVDAAARDRRPFAYEARIVRPDGGVRICHSRGEVLADEAGRPVRMVGVCQDVTERRQAEGALRRSEDKFSRLFRSSPVAVAACTVAEGRFLDANERYLELYGYRREEIIGRTVHELGLWTDLERRGEVIRRLLETGSVQNVEAGFRRRSGETFDGVISMETVELSESAEPVIVAMLMDITERKRAEEERRRLLESERAARADAEAALARLRAIQSVTDAALAQLGLDDLLSEILARIRGVLDADSAVVLLLSPEQAFLTVRASQGMKGRSVRTGHIRVGEGIAGRIAASRRPLIVEDLREAEVVRPTLRDHVRSLLGVPLLVEGQVIGVLHVGSHRARRFTDEDVRLLQLVADRVAPAIDRARLFEEASEGRKRLQALSRRLVHIQEAERREVARELHDEIGQLLTGLKLLMEGGRRPGAKAAARAAAGGRGQKPRRGGEPEMEGLVNEIMGRVRDLSMNLRPAILDDLGLVPALLWHVDRYSSQTGVRVSFQHAGLESRLPPDVETAAFRTVQEALTNVARHADVRDVRVEVVAEPQHLTIRVEDLGKGFDLRTVLSGTSSGITGLQERVHLLGGRTTIESAPGAGTRLSAEIPLGAGRPAGSRR